MIALSATNWNNEYNEKDYIEQTLGFKVHDSMLKETFKFKPDLPAKTPDNFFKDNIERAKLVYCEEKDV